MHFLHNPHSYALAVQHCAGTYGGRPMVYNHTEKGPSIDPLEYHAGRSRLRR